MKKIISIAIATVVTASVFIACGSSASIKSEQDSVAYAHGIFFGNAIKSYDSTMNLNLVIQGMKDFMKDNPKFDLEEAIAFMNEYEFVRKPIRAKVAGEEFLSKIESENKNIQKTESGILYEVINPGDSEIKATDDNDVVKVMYAGTLKDGTQFDSSYDRGEPVEFALNRVIRGWTEGMKLVGKGGKIKLYIPSDLAYGQQGQRGGPVTIGPNEPLIFEVELLDVTPAEEE